MFESMLRRFRTGPQLLADDEKKAAAKPARRQLRLLDMVCSHIFVYIY
jgi:hypothetical protein